MQLPQRRFAPCPPGKRPRGKQQISRAGHTSEMRGDMKALQTKMATIKKSLAEFLVIVTGVVIGLAADRWIKGMDGRKEESKYYANLVANLRSDSIRLAANAARADSEAAYALQLLLFVEDDRLPAGVDTITFLRRVSSLAYFTPTDFARETWDDMVSSGKVQAISNDSLRQKLSAYYNGLEQLAGYERDWEAQLAEFELEAWTTQEPMGRLIFLGDSEIPAAIRGRYPAQRVLAGVRNSIRSAARLHAALGQVRYIRNRSENAYLRELGNVSRLLAEAHID
jgi:hypothetical protein